MVLRRYAMHVLGNMEPPNNKIIQNKIQCNFSLESFNNENIFDLIKVYCIL